MATLSDLFQARYSSQMVLNLTNPDDPDAVAVDTDRLDAAIADVKADFERLAWVTLDETNVDADHIPLACTGIYLRLLERTGAAPEGYAEMLASYNSQLFKLAQISARSRMVDRYTAT